MNDIIRGWRDDPIPKRGNQSSGPGCWEGRPKKTGTYPIGDCSAHAGNQCNASPVAKANHLLGNGLGGHEHSRDVDLEHGIRVLGRVLERRGFLLDARRRDQAIEPALCIGDGLDGAIEQFRVAHVDATVVEFRVEFADGPLLYFPEFWRLGCWLVGCDTLYQVWLV